MYESLGWVLKDEYKFGSWMDIGVGGVGDEKVILSNGKTMCKKQEGIGQYII